ncbi:kinase-like domain-containing protein [Daldinia sp. FL1419]|nr:kinase-like domain-containing protein [Daldinia sp. FL1419]
MADDGQPKNYPERVQLQNYQFGKYRKDGWTTRWDRDMIRQMRPHWERFRVPALAPPAVFDGDGHHMPWIPRLYAGGGNNPHKQETDVDDPKHGSDPYINSVKDRLAGAKIYFSSNAFRYQKTLGHGGLGLALHYRYEGQGDHRDVVLKVPLRNWEADDFREEGNHMEMLRGAAHAVQSIDPKDIRRRELLPYYRYPQADDSSSEEESSGDESVAGPTRPAKRPRIPMNSAQIEERRQRIRDHQRAWGDRRTREGNTRRRRDYLLLEYLEGGDLRGLIKRLTQAAPGRGTGVTKIPNRILWMIWLCLVRACVGMKYPPRKFHPERFQRKDLIENAPPATKRWRAKNIVHFDIDPTNILIGNVERPPEDPDTEAPDTEATETSSKGKEKARGKTFKLTMTYLSGLMRTMDITSKPWKKTKTENRKRKFDEYQSDRAEGEHVLFPRIKLGDFGLTEVIKPYKTNQYYQRRRTMGKEGYLAPEQFAAVWDKIPPNPYGFEIGVDPITGSYSSATNIWGIALTMWIIITQKAVPQPPQPQIPPGSGITRGGSLLGSIDAAVRNLHPDHPVSYCPLLMDGQFNHVDVDLRKTIYECMYHNPLHRPTVEALLIQAREGIKKQFAGETDEAVNAWVNKFIFSADT